MPHFTQAKEAAEQMREAEKPEVLTALKRLIANIETDAEMVKGLTLKQWIAFNESSLYQARTAIAKTGA